MSIAADFRKAAELSVDNVARHGDTDIFPFPFENYAFSDLRNKFVELVLEYNTNFEKFINDYPPQHVNSLTPAGYFGFRWASQIDPIWNLHFLACVIAIAPDIEVARIPLKEEVVFSYRFNPNYETGDLFDKTVSWANFIEASVEEAAQHEFVVTCDISEFYPRLGHHRLENALLQIDKSGHVSKKIMKFLSNFSNTRSFGLPIGGSAARLLSEITINQVDRLLYYKNIKFKRFADDYHIFASSREDAYSKLMFLSEKLFDNQGLSMQKAKTRIMSSAEFRATNPLAIERAQVDPEQAGADAAEKHSRTAILRFSLNFDPYSPTAEEDYQELRKEIQKFDIIGLLKSELSKSRVHTALTKKLISAVKHLDVRQREEAVLSIWKNQEILYPTFASVLVLMDSVIDSMTVEGRRKIIDAILELINKESYLLRADTHMCYAIRVLAHENMPETIGALQQLYETRLSPIVRRDIILILARWNEWYWISDLRNKFRSLSGAERRAFIVASHALKDEGRHWRQSTKREFDPFEKLIAEWADSRTQTPNWRIPV
ncbi:RNA-directed DNA polymerase [Mesorhizobium sp. NPDC059054]|uniref:RNA-directed DNA polymerase n=1 Tax=Mesorhizobium sp. NPDC059054 TaxID=3346711 RepID=UPI0036A9ECEA